MIKAKVKEIRPMVINDFRSNKTQKEKDEIIILIDAGMSKRF